MAAAESNKANTFQIVANNDVGHRVKDELYVGRVGGARKVCEDVLVRRVIAHLKLLLYIGGGLLEIVSARILGKTGLQRRFANLLRKKILLVEKENDGSVAEPLVAAD